MAVKSKKKLNLKQTVITLVAIYVVCHLIYGGSNIVELKSQQRQLASELDAAYSEQVKLQDELEYMNTQDAIEKTAREKLGLIKDGEILVRRLETASSK